MGDADCFCHGRQVPTIDSALLDEQDRDYVAPLALRCAAPEPVPVQLLQEDVFRRVDVEIPVRIGGYLDKLPPEQLLMVEKRGCRKEIDLDAGGTVNEVRTASGIDGAPMASRSA